MQGIELQEKKSTKRLKHPGNLLKEPTVNRYLVILDLKPFTTQLKNKYIPNLQGDLRPEFHQFFVIIFVHFIEKIPFTKFCAILIIFQEVMK